MIHNQYICVQDEDKKSAAGDGQTTEDESSQDSKGESQVSVDPAPAQGNADVDQPDSKEEDKQSINEGQVLVPVESHSLVNVFTSQCSSTWQLTYWG